MTRERKLGSPRRRSIDSSVGGAGANVATGLCTARSSSESQSSVMRTGGVAITSEIWTAPLIECKPSISA